VQQVILSVLFNCTAQYRYICSIGEYSIFFHVWLFYLLLINLSNDECCILHVLTAMSRATNSVILRRAANGVIIVIMIIIIIYVKKT